MTDPRRNDRPATLVLAALTSLGLLAVTSLGAGLYFAGRPEPQAEISPWGTTILITVGIVIAFFPFIPLLVSAKRRRRIAGELSDLRRGEADNGGRHRVELRRLDQFQAFAQRTTEIEQALSAYMPNNMRQAKRLSNHLRLTALIAYQRGLFEPGSLIDIRHVAKWAVLCERWPRLGATLTATPDRLAVLESATNVETLRAQLTEVRLTIEHVDDLFAILRESPALSPVIVGLVRFERVGRRPAWTDTADWLQGSSEHPVAPN